MIPQKPIRCAYSHRGTSSEEGYILLGVLILLAIFIIGMAAAAPKIASDIQRDREVETMHRGKQYIRAVQLYYKKFQAYPPNIEALVKTQEVRFLRKRYKDPLTGKDDWKPIMYCQNKAPIAMGFFGQPLGATSGCGTLAGIGPTGGNGVQGGGLFSNGQNSIGTTGTTGSLPSTSPAGNSLFNSGTDSSATGSPSSTIGAPGASDGSAGQTGISPTGTTGSPSTGTTPGASTGTTDANGNPTSADNGQTLGGGGIIGFSPPIDKNSILIYKKKKKYNEWEFTYGPQMDQQMMMGGNAGTIGQPAGGAGVTTPTAGSGSTFGPNGGGISNPTSPTSPVQTSPQQ